MTSPFSDRTVWFLTGSQDLYGEDMLAQVAAQSQRIVEQLQPEVPLTIKWVPVLKDSEAIRRTMLEANSDDGCVGLIAWMHTFSPAKMWIRGLDALDKPLLHFHTQANQSLPWSSLDMNFMNLNQAAHGDREFGYVQTRIGFTRTTVVGHVGDGHTRLRIAKWARVATAWDAMRRTKLARFGDNMRGVAVTEGDKVEAELHFGASINTYAVNDLVAVVDDVPDAAIDELIEAYLDSYDLDPSLLPGAQRHDSLRAGARIEAGLRQFLNDGGFTAFTTNFEDLGGLRQLPGLAVQRLMAEGYGFGGEGDWKTALLLHTLKVMATGLPGGTSFMEDYTYHYGPGPQRILGAHMLEVCPSLTAGRPRLEIHPLGIGNREDPVRLKFTADPGPGIVVGLADLGNRFRFTADVVEVVEPDESLPRLPVACAVWEPQPSLATSAECWLAAGGPHHENRARAHRRRHDGSFLRRQPPSRGCLLPPGPLTPRQAAGLSPIRAIPAVLTVEFGAPRADCRRAVRRAVASRASPGRRRA
jgi:L-arabinose isomerase